MLCCFSSSLVLDTRTERLEDFVVGWQWDMSETSLPDHPRLSLYCMKLCETISDSGLLASWTEGQWILP